MNFELNPKGFVSSALVLNESWYHFTQTLSMRFLNLDFYNFQHVFLNCKWCHFGWCRRQPRLLRGKGGLLSRGFSRCFGLQRRWPLRRRRVAPREEPEREEVKAPRNGSLWWKKSKFQTTKKIIPKNMFFLVSQSTKFTFWLILFNLIGFCSVQLFWRRTQRRAGLAFHHTWGSELSKSQ